MASPRAAPAHGHSSYEVKLAPTITYVSQVRSHFVARANLLWLTGAAALAVPKEQCRTRAQG